ncbi:uncharacterized protein BDZ99DRAFT_395629 [Mytilinidion resinicola]|uniref:peptidylprolyl isomerase n=1 Tax=Mytilinidion resinicola TaxID=574789 RepID=A0A6A6YD28_9PEZI|nr:uncharacterized protein BDZ99DRAFT_395629 [Mytilinidion resinicola]KAF2805747.1 hypothetical protein BDZ99DRAFT_395629 [Mytilinidion resinicola]
MPSTIRPRMFLELSAGTEPIGRLVVELFIDQTPKTCENFRVLCTGSKSPLSYRLTPIHRVIEGFMIQGGDTTNRDGTGGVSIYGDTFEDENIRWKDIDAPGLLCMANRCKDLNGSQFFITLRPCPHLNGKHTVFGHLISGQSVLDRILEIPVDKTYRPTIPILISRCGELQPPQARAIASASATTSEDRGRRKRRRSTSRSPARSESPSRGHHRRSASRHRYDPRKHRHISSSPSSTPPKHRIRRRSDASLDHNLRGRPRQRSRHRTRSPILESASPSPGRYRRKRSQPPSRRREYREGRSPDQRRQRSLPNIYYDESGTPRKREGSGLGEVMRT